MVRAREGRYQLLHKLGHRPRTDQLSARFWALPRGHVKGLTHKALKVTHIATLSKELGDLINQAKRLTPPSAPLSLISRLCNADQLLKELSVIEP